MKKDTFFNNSTTQSSSAKRKGKRKFLKTFSFSALALLMGTAGVFAFAPLGAGAPLATANESEKTTYTTEQGLITPKADDPVIYTTESGLEIKYGNSASSIFNNSLASGNLAGFPYFTTSKNGTTYTWVIIGRNADTTIFSSAISSHLFSTWKSTYNKSGTLFNTNAYYFFNNTFESTTPAGSAINGIVPSKSYVSDLTVNNYALKTSTEIPSGCVLCLTNDVVEYARWAEGSENLAAATGYFSGTNNRARKLYESYDTNDKFGFGTNKNYVQEVALTQRSSYYNDSSGNSNYYWNWSTTTTSLRFFPLGTGGTTSATPTATNVANHENFRWQTYLTAAQVKCSKAFWGRSHCDSDDIFYTDTSGVVQHLGFGVSGYTNIYMRAACVLKVQ